MGITYIIVVVVVVLVIGAVLAPIFVRSRRAKRYQVKFGPDYDHTVKAMGGHTEAQTEMDARAKHVESLVIRPLSMTEHTRYVADWNVVQIQICWNKPGQAIVDADRLIMEVMQVRGFPLSNFEERAADISINYPDLVSNYRATAEIALKNKQHQASTEELRQATVYYRSLFDELLKPEAVVEMAV